MDLLHWFIDLVLHLDKHLVELLRDYHFWVYAILFAIVFAETGFVVTPFLPGDSLLFAAGALAEGSKGISRIGRSYCCIIAWPKRIPTPGSWW